MSKTNDLTLQLADIIQDQFEDDNLDTYVNFLDCCNGVLRFESEYYTPNNGDEISWINGNCVDDLSRDLYRLSNDFDIDEHVFMWLGAKNSGVSNVPDVIGLVEDAQFITAHLEDLAMSLQRMPAKNKERFDNIAAMLIKADL